MVLETAIVRDLRSVVGIWEVESGFAYCSGWEG